MPKNSTAQKTQENDFLKSHLLVVKPNTEKATAKTIDFKSSAEETASEPVVTEAKAPEVQEVKEVKAEPTPPVPEAKAEPTPPVTEVKPVQSIEDIKRKSEVLSRLTAKWDSLIEKRKRVENFAISHDGDTASAIIKDAHGEIFESNSPKTISRLIDFCKDEFSEAIAIVEKEMREIA